MAFSVRRLLFSAAVAAAALSQTRSAQADDLYVSSDTAIYEINPSGTITTFAAGLNEPAGLAYRNGNLYVADDSGSLFAYALNGQQTVLATGLSSPQGVAVDANGNVFEADYGTSSILKIAPNGNVTTFITGIGVEGLKFDATGNLYAADINDDSIVKFTPAGVMSTVATGLNTPDDLAFDSKGNLYVSENTGYDIIEIAPNGTMSTFAANLNTPEGLAFDGQGNLYEADFGSNSIFEFTPTGTQSTFAAVSDPFGLVFAPASVPETGTFLIALLGFLPVRLLVRRYAH